MDIPSTSNGDLLAEPIRARLLRALTDLRRPATTQELAGLVGRHPNTVRVQLARLADAGLLECRRAPQPRGRPRQVWVVASRARPAGQPPQAYGQLAEWLARAIGRTGRMADIEDGGREIGREIAPDRLGGATADALEDALTALGFAPRREALDGGARYVLGNCPYRDAVAQNQAAVCSLHRGITAGLLDRLDPAARLADFVAKDPYAAGCVIDVALPQQSAPV
jgi:predicted ArsR family transcriptional regulator